MAYKTILTNFGKSAIATAAASGTKVNIVTFAVGDGGGTQYTPTPDMTALKGQKWSGAVTDYSVDGNIITITSVVPPDVGGWTIRELGVLDDQNHLIAVANYPDTLKVQASQGVAGEFELSVQIAVLNADTLSISIDPSSVSATKAELQAVNSSLGGRITKLESNAYPKRYGVRWPLNATNPVGERTGDAIGLLAGVGTDATAPQNDFDKIMPWAGRRECNGHFTDAGGFVVTAYKGEPGFTATGADVYVETPLFYYRDCVDGSYDVMEISMFQYDGFFPSPHCIKADGTLRSYSYTPKYRLAMVNDLPTSISGVFSDYGSLTSLMTNAAAKGAGYILETTAEKYVDTILAVVEFATRNLQSIMAGASVMPYSNTSRATVAETGTNRIVVDKAYASKFIVGQAISISATDVSADEKAKNRLVTSVQTYDTNTSAIYFDGATITTAVGDYVGSRPWKNGATDSVIASSGSPISNTDGLHPCIYRGKEDPWGDVWCYLSDILAKRDGDAGAYTYSLYHIADPSKYSNGAITADYVKLDYPIPGIDGYISKLGSDPRFPWIRLATENTGSSTTRFCDYFWYPRDPVSAAMVGGHLNDGSDVGPFSLACNGAPSVSVWLRRARLSHITG